MHSPAHLAPIIIGASDKSTHRPLSTGLVPTRAPHRAPPHCSLSYCCGEAVALCRTSRPLLCVLCVGWCVSQSALELEDEPQRRSIDRLVRIWKIKEEHALAAVPLLCLLELADNRYPCPGMRAAVSQGDISNKLGGTAAAASNHDYQSPPPFFPTSPRLLF